MNRLVSDSVGTRHARVAGALIAALGLVPAATPALADIWQLPPPPSHASAESSTASTHGSRPSQPTAAEPSADDPHYARICDAFGEGFTYSPGTGTCIKIGGYVKFGTAFGGRH